MLRTASIPVHEVLELGSGGGHNAGHLKAHFPLTLVDLSDEMLAVSRRLNPECDHLPGDMRSRPPRPALRRGLRPRRRRLHDHRVRPPAGGRDGVRALPARRHRASFPDCTAETFDPGSDHGGTDAPDGRGVRYLEWVWDPDPGDPGPAPNTRSFSATPTAPCARSTRRTDTGCSAATAGCGPRRRRVRPVRSSRRRPARTARHGTSSSGTGRRRRHDRVQRGHRLAWSVEGSCWPGAKRGLA